MVISTKDVPHTGPQRDWFPQAHFYAVYMMQTNSDRCTRSTCCLVAMTSASHAEGRQFDPGQVYLLLMTLRNIDDYSSVEDLR